MLSIATWNVNSLKIRFDQVLKWLETHSPDVLAIQEIKLQEQNISLEAIHALGYKTILSGQKAYNGVAIFSKFEMRDALTDVPNFQDEARRILAVTINDVRIINLYVPNGQSVDSPKYHYKLEWLREVTHFIHAQLNQYSRLVVLGDFNIAPEDQDVHDPEKWRGHVLFSEPERQALIKMCDAGLTDSFRLFPQPEKSYTWWDYRMLGFRRNHGLRIDHILVSQTMAEKCVRCTIDKEPRKWERPSDHAPVTAQFDINSIIDQA